MSKEKKEEKKGPVKEAAKETAAKQSAQHQDSQSSKTASQTAPKAQTPKAQEPKARAPFVPVKTPKLLEHYRKTAVPAMMKEFHHKNALAVPRIDKVMVHMGVKEGAADNKLLEQIALELAQITGQKPLVTRAKKSISAFHLREGSPIGLKVTLRKMRMYEFIERLFNVAMPRIRDFRGFPGTSFDGSGNYSFGLQEQIIFPEVDYDKMKKTQGMDITFVTTTENEEEAKRLLELMGFPFRKQG